MNAPIPQDIRTRFDIKVMFGERPDFRGMVVVDSIAPLVSTGIVTGTCTRFNRAYSSYFPRAGITVGVAFEIAAQIIANYSKVQAGPTCLNMTSSNRDKLLDHYLQPEWKRRQEPHYLRRLLCTPVLQHPRLCL